MNLLSNSEYEHDNRPGKVTGIEYPATEEDVISEDEIEPTESE